MRKNVQNIVAVFLCVSTIFMCVGCAAVPNCIVIEDATRYLRVDSFVSKELSISFNGILPEQNTLNQDSARYYYSYNSPLLGNRSFVIYLNNMIADPNEYSKERERIISLSDGVISDNKERVVYYVGDLKSAIQLYADDKIQDGMSIRFELAIVNEQTESIEYLVALQQDGAKQSEIILSVLSKIA